MKKLFFAFAALAALVSCVREDGLGAPEPRMVSLVTVDTKAVLSDNDVRWENGDEVTLVFTSADKVFKSDFSADIEGETAATATFRGLLDEDVDEAHGYADGFAVYPSGIVDEDGSVSFTVPVEQTPRENGSFADDLNLASSLVDLSDLTDNGKASVSFNNALALVKFRFPENVKSVEIVSTAPLSGAADLKLSEVSGEEGRLVFAEEVAVSDANSKVTLLPPTGSRTFDPEVYYSVLVWPGDHALTIGLTDTDGCVDTKTVTRTLKASESYKFNVSDKFVKPFTLSVNGIEDGKEVALVFPASAPGAEPLYCETLTVVDGKISGSLPASVAHEDNLPGYVVYPAEYAYEDFELASDQKAGESYEYLRGDVNLLVTGAAYVSMVDQLRTVEMTLPENRIQSVTLAITCQGQELGYNLDPAEGEDCLPVSVSFRIMPFDGEYTAVMIFTDVDCCTKTESMSLFDGVIAVDAEGFYKDVSLDVEGVADGESVDVLFASSDWDEAVVCRIDPDLTVEDIPCGFYNSDVKGIAIWNKSFTGIPSNQSAAYEGSLKTAALDMAAIKAGTQTSAVFADALATVNFTLPDDVASVKIEVAEGYIAGTAVLGVNEDGSLKVEWGSGASGTITSAGGPVVMFPGTYDHKITLTDSHGCTSVSDHEDLVLTAGTNTLVLDGSFVRTFSLSVADGSICPADAQIAVVFAKDGEAPVVHKMTMSGGVCNGQISDQVTVGNGYAAYAVYPADRVAEDGTVTYDVQAGNVAGEYSIAYAKVDLSAIESSRLVLDFKSLLQSLSLTLPDDAEKVIVTSTKPIGGTLSIAADGTVTYPASGSNSTEIALTEREVEVTVFDVEQTFDVEVYDGDGCKFIKTGLSGYSHELAEDFTKYAVMSTTGAPDDARVYLQTAFQSYPASETAAGVYDLEMVGFHVVGNAFCAVATTSSSLTLTIPAAQSGNESYVLSTCVIPAEDFEDNQVTATFESRLQTLEFTLPADVVKVTVTSSDDKPIAGTVGVGPDGSLTISDGDAQIVYTLSSASAIDDVCAVTAIEGAASYDIILENAAGHILTFDGKSADDLDFSDETFIQPIALNPTAVASHVYEDGILTGSQVALNFGASDEDLARIKDLDVKVTSGGTVYKTFTADRVKDNEFTLTDGGKVYMPKDLSYTVEITYKDNEGLSTTPQTISCTGPGDPSYTLDLNFTATTTSVTIHSATVSISESVLAEMQLSCDNANDMWIRFAGGTAAIFRSEHLNPQKSVFISEKTVNSAPYLSGYYGLGCFVQFDGVKGSVKYTTSNTMNGTNVTPISPKKYYKKSSQLQYATELQDGKMYVVEAMCRTGKYWYVDDSGMLKLSESAPSNDDIPETYIFMYKVDNSQSVSMEEGYHLYSSVGAWYSVSNEKYMNTNDFPPNFNSATPVRYVKCGTGWGSSPGSKDFDISKGYSNASPQLLRYDEEFNASVYWRSNESPSNYWKWYIYEVVYE